MVKQLKTYLKYGNLFCGIEHTVKKGQDLVYVTVLKKSKNAIDIEDVHQETSIENVISKLPKKQHVFLIINNDHILTKQITSSQSEPLKLIHAAFPNINLDDFYFEVVTQQQKHFVSICRKAHLDQLIATYQSNALHVINIALGNMIASSISQFINRETLITSNANTSIENGIINAIEKKEIEVSTDYDINGIRVDNNHILSLSGALGSILHNFYPVTNFDALKLSLKSEYNQSRFFTQFLKIGLIFLLISLLINFFVFNHYFNKVSTLQQTSQVNQSTKKKVLELNEAVSKSQKMVDDMLKSSSSKSSFYINIIIQSLPNSLLLSELNYQPLKKNIKSDKPIELDDNTIIISGESNNSDQFSTWIADLEAIEWIINIEVLNYKDTSKSVSVFSIKLNIMHD